MKKSKVLIPAMALLLFSTAASITGTVAWFTSTRTFTTSVGSFSVAKLEGNLECTPTAIVGTTVSGTTVSVVTGGVIGDASFDHNAHKLYTDNPSAGGFKLIDTMSGSAGNFAAGTVANWEYNTTGSTKYYYAVAWKFKFDYTFIAETKNVNLFFDYHASTMTPSGDAHASGNDTAKGFRIALMGATNSIVWSELNNGVCRVLSSSTPSSTYVDSSDPLTYVMGTDPASTTSYVAADHFINSSENAAAYSRVQDGGSIDGRKDYLGTFTNPGTSGTVSSYVTCVAWFEGTSGNVVDATRMATIAASMTFYATLAA